MANSHGWPALSDWWRSTLTDYYLSGAQQCVIRKPRRIGASTVIAPLVMVCEALHGQHRIPPNDVAFCLFFSVTKSEAGKRLRGIRSILDALRVPYREAGDTIE